MIKTWYQVREHIKGSKISWRLVETETLEEAQVFLAKEIEAARSNNELTEKKFFIAKYTKEIIETVHF